MEKLIIQIYEIQNPSEAETMLKLGVDHIGSVLLSQETWKVPSIRETIRLVAETGSKSSLIPLFSGPDDVYRSLDYYEPDMVHFCESLTDPHGISKACDHLVRLQEGVKKRFPEFRIIRSIPMAQTEKGDGVPSLELARMFEPVSDLFLTDTLIIKDSAHEDQPVSGFVGITGQRCDWNVARELVKSATIPVILAGGLSPENVSDGITQVRPAGVDSCTQTNALDEDGRPIRFKKDHEKVRRFVEEVRSLMLDAGMPDFQRCQLPAGGSHRNSGPSVASTGRITP